MNSKQKNKITLEAIVKAPIDEVWKFWTAPEHITRWNNASSDWHTPSARSDLRPGGEFLFRMEAKDGSVGFDFSGVYDEVKAREFIGYTIGDGRKVEISFTNFGTSTKVVETFEAENHNPIEMQHDGWQAILNNFKNYIENRL